MEIDTEIKLHLTVIQFIISTAVYEWSRYSVAEFRSGQLFLSYSRKQLKRCCRILINFYVHKMPINQWPSLVPRPFRQKQFSLFLAPSFPAVTDIPPTFEETLAERCWQQMTCLYMLWFRNTRLSRRNFPEFD